MALNIKSPEADRLARELAAVTGESITVTITRSLSERLERERRVRDRKRQLARAAALDEIFDRMADAQVIDARPADELLGYNDIGTFD